MMAIWKFMHPACMGFFGLATIAISMPAMASPFEVDDLDAAESPEVAIVGAFEDGHGEVVWEGPALDIAILVASGIEFSTVVGRGTIDPAGGSSTSGWLDTEIGLKWQILQPPDEGGFGVTLAPAVLVPTGTHELGEGVWQAELPILFGWVQDDYELRVLVGYAHSLETSDHEYIYGVLAQKEVAPGFALGAEVVGGMEKPFAQSPKATANIGFSLALSSSIAIEGRVGQSLHNADHQKVTNGYLALQFAF